MTLREAMIDALIDGWTSDWVMARVVTHAWRLAEQDLEVDRAKMYTELGKAIKVRHIHGASTAKAWIGSNLRPFNEALWAGRSRDVAAQVLRRSLGGRRPVTGRFLVKVRDQDKRHDWHTVK